MGKFHQGSYTPINPGKYIGTYPIYWRSSWEHKMMVTLDTHPSIVNWASESIQIPYVNPFTHKPAIYVPDFFIVYDDKGNRRKSEIIEVKPLKETSMNEAKSQKDKASVVLNMHKWKAAYEWTKQRGIGFRIMTEHDIFNRPSGKR